MCKKAERGAYYLHQKSTAPCHGSTQRQPPSNRITAFCRQWGRFCCWDVRSSPINTCHQSARFRVPMRNPIVQVIKRHAARIRSSGTASRHQCRTNQPRMCLRATGGPNRRPGPNQPGTPAPGGRGTDAPRPPPVRTRFNGTTAPDVGFRARRGSGAVGDRGERDGSQPPEAATEGARRTARASDSFPGHQVYSKRARLPCSELATKLLISNIGKQGCRPVSSARPPFLDRAGQEQPLGGRRATWLPPPTQARAPRSPSAISPRGRSGDRL